MRTAALLGYDAASSGNSSSTFRDTLSAPSSKAKNPKRWDRQIVPQTSVRNCHCSLRNGPEQRGSQDFTCMQKTLASQYFALYFICRKIHAMRVYIVSTTYLCLILRYGAVTHVFLWFLHISRLNCYTHFPQFVKGRIKFGLLLLLLLLLSKNALNIKSQNQCLFPYNFLFISIKRKHGL